MNNKNLEFVNPNLSLSNEVIVVGSSSNLLKNYGELIDSYKNIIRFNRAPVNKFEEHVGHKTTLRVLNNHVFENKKMSNQYTGQPKRFIKTLKNTSILRVGPGEPSSKMINKFEKKNNLVYFFNFNEINKLKKKVEFNSEKNMSVGLITIAIMLISNLKVNIIGFDIDKQEVTHYWEDRPKQMSKYHKITYEKAWLKNLIDNNKINYIG